MDIAPRRTLACFGRGRVALVAIVSLVTGVAGGWWLGSGNSTSSVPRRARDVPKLLPRPSLAEQHTVIVGTVEEDLEPEKDDEGRLILRAAGPARVLIFEGEDAEPAQAVVERFVSALRPGLVTERRPGHVLVDGTRILWRLEGHGSARLLRVVAIPADPNSFDSHSARYAEGIAHFAIVNKLYSTTVSRFQGQLAASTEVHHPRWKLRQPVSDAAKEVFRERGLTLVQEEIAQGLGALVARGSGGDLIWSVAWMEDQGAGTLGARHHANPFDTAGEQEMLRAIFRRASGENVVIKLRQ